MAIQTRFCLSRLWSLLRTKWCCVVCASKPSPLLNVYEILPQSSKRDPSLTRAKARLGQGKLRYRQLVQAKAKKIATTTGNEKNSLLEQESEAAQSHTYFEANPPFPEGDKRRYGYGSRPPPFPTPGGSWPPVMSSPRAAGLAPMGRREPAAALSRLRAPLKGPTRSGRRANDRRCGGEGA